MALNPGVIRQDGNLNFPANTHIKYSRRQLLSFKSRAAVPDNLFNLLKTQGILKSCRVRAGRLHKQRIRPISTLLGSRRANCNYISNTNSMGSRNLHLGVNKNLISVDLNTSNSFSSTSSATKLLKTCHLNSHSINNKSTIIKDYVVETDVDVMALTETWLTPDSESDFAIRNITPSQYAFLHNPRINRGGGGVGLLYKSSLKVERQNQIETFKSFQYLEVILSNVTVTRIIIVYRLPQSKNNCVSNSLFFEDFPVLLEHLATASGKLIMLGDFNFCVDDTDNASAMKFLDILNCFNLAQHMTVPTHKDGHTFDLIITRNDEDLISNIDVHDPLISDHFACFCSWNVCKANTRRKLITYRKLRNIDHKGFGRDLIDSPLLSSSARPSAPWYNNEIASQKTLRRKLERRWRRTKLDIDRQAYTNQRVRIQDLIINSKIKFYSKLISEAGDDQKSLFSSVSRLLHRKPEVLYPVCSSDSILANNFADYFETKIYNIRKELDTIKLLPSDYSSVDMASRSNCELKEFTIATTEEVRHIVNKFSSKSCCLDPVPSSVFVKHLDLLVPVITNIVNLSLKSSTMSL